MKDLCFCIKIHIPAPHLNYRFFNIDRSHNYVNGEGIEQHINRICIEQLLPFLQTIKSLSFNSGKNLRFAVSVSGSSLNLLKKFSKPVMELIYELANKDYFELLSEPWTHSFLPYMDSDLLVSQTNLHSKIIQDTFKIVPKIFIVHSPIHSPQMSQKLEQIEKEGIITCTNFIKREAFLNRNKRGQTHTAGLPCLLINKHISNQLNQFDVNCIDQLKPEMISKAVKKIKQNLSEEYPLIFVYDPTLSKRSFNLNRAIFWKKLFDLMLNDLELNFVFPSTIIKKEDSMVLTKNVEISGLVYPAVRNLWLNNSLQKDAFKNLLSVNTLFQREYSSVLEPDWFLIQDMDYFFYMNSFFLTEKYAADYYNPFSSPYLAYINYMNVLDDFSVRLKKKETKTGLIPG